MSDSPTPGPSLRASAQQDGEPLAPAAAVLLTRGDGQSLELYLVRRNPKLRVFPGFWALPGGGLDAVDGDPLAGDLCAYRCAAARELFEETGVLVGSLAQAPRSGEERRRVRAGLELNERHPSAAEGCEAQQLWVGWLAGRELPPDELVPLCWTTTPRFALKRFRALYVHLELPAGEAPRIVPGELVEGRWATPVALLAEWRRGELDLVPPIVFLLEALEASAGRLGPAFARAEARSLAVDQGALHVVSPAPGVLLAPLRTPTLPPAATTNCVLIGGRPLYIVDPATYDAAERQRLLDYLAEQPQLRPAGVLVTHHHPDHVGSVLELSAALDVPVYAHPLTLERLPGRPLRSVPLEEGARLPLGTAPDGSPDWFLEALHTPGHDRGHLCFLDSRYRTLIGGDLVSTLSTIVIEPPEGHLATYLAELRRVQALAPRRLVPSHGPAVANGVELIAVYLRHREQREAQLLAALGTGPMEPEALLRLVYADVPEGLLPLARGSLWAGLWKLKEEGRVRFLGPGEPPPGASRMGLPPGSWARIDGFVDSAPIHGR